MLQRKKFSRKKYFGDVCEFSSASGVLKLHDTNKSTLKL